MGTVGRPRVITVKVVQKLEEHFRAGFSVSKTCHLSGISRSVYYEQLSDNKQFMDRMQLAQRVGY